MKNEVKKDLKKDAKVDKKNAKELDGENFLLLLLFLISFCHCTHEIVFPCLQNKKGNYCYDKKK